MKSRYEKYILNIKQIYNILEGRDVIVFGAGIDGGKFYTSTINKLNILYYVDNGNLNGYVLYGNRIVDFTYLKVNYKNELIIVASAKYNAEIALQLENEGFVPGVNFYIWDGFTGDQNDFYDDNTNEFIELNKKLWGKQKKEHSGNKVLIPYRKTAEMVYAPWSYAANYLSEKYDADIYCAGGVRDVKEDGLWRIYESFNVSGFIDETPDKRMNEEIDRLFYQIWGSIHSEKDIKNISIYGENYGIDILRDYLRLHYPKIFINDITLKRQIRQMIGYVVFWHWYLMKNADKVKAIIVWDGLYYREGIMRKIAYGYGIPVYTVVNLTCFKWNYDMEYSFEFYKKFFYMLSEQERREGVKWAQKKMKALICGSVEKTSMVQKSVFSSETMHPLLRKNDKLKIVICPHYMEDDAFPYGNILFTDQWEWLEYLGKLSQNTEYDWYLKPHPLEKELGDKLIDDYVQKYPNIKILPKYVSPIQMKNEGMEYALTIHGSIGYEYPYIGINVINAGYNPHVAFDFDINPESREEYEDVLNNLKTIKKSVNIEEIYQFYCIHFGYYLLRRRDMMNVFFLDSRLRDIRGLVGSKTKSSTKLFKYYVDEMSDRRHDELKQLFKNLFREMDEYKEGIFYKQSLSWE